MANKVEHNKKALLEALKASNGVVTTACDSVGIGRTTYYEYMNNDPEFNKQVKDLSECAIDFVESKLFERIKGTKAIDESGQEYYRQPPSDTAMIFYLKTKAKHRGYIERMEHINENREIIVKVGDEKEDNQE